MKKCIMAAAMLAVVVWVCSAGAETVEQATNGNVNAAMDIYLTGDNTFTYYVELTGYGAFAPDSYAVDVFNQSINPYPTLVLSAPSVDQVFKFDGVGVDAFVSPAPSGSNYDTTGYGGLGYSPIFNSLEWNVFSNVKTSHGLDTATILFVAEIQADFNGSGVGTGFFSLGNLPQLDQLTISQGELGLPLPAPALMGVAGIIGIGVWKKLARKAA